jgi:hypothetical protein
MDKLCLFRPISPFFQNESKEHIRINADLNGSANILRKYYPDAFKDHAPDFRNIVVITHPDLALLQK